MSAAAFSGYCCACEVRVQPASAIGVFMPGAAELCPVIYLLCAGCKSAVESCDAATRERIDARIKRAYRINRSDAGTCQ